MSLGGVIAHYVNNMVCGGTQRFHDVVLKSLRDIYPFKDWKIGFGKFFGYWLE